MKIETMSARIFSLSWRAPCQSMSNHVAALCHRDFRRLARRAVAIAVHLRPFEQGIGVAHALEIAHLDEVVVDAVDLAAAARPRGDADRQLEARIRFQQIACDRRFAGARGGRQHQHQAATPDRGERNGVRVSAHAPTPGSAPARETGRRRP
jgi:hypothetical protein